jgi:hypothetical protein
VSRFGDCDNDSEFANLDWGRWEHNVKQILGDLLMEWKRVRPPILTLSPKVLLEAGRVA